jgi:hypothetical protein
MTERANFKMVARRNSTRDVVAVGEKEEKSRE